MMQQELGPKWSLWGFAQRFRRTIRQPADLVLAAEIGYFVWTLPAKLGKSDLPMLLDQLWSLPRPRAKDLAASIERITRLRGAWLRLWFLRERDTCYLRALTLYRFLDPGMGTMRIHFVVEPRVDARDRLRGHAWVSVDGQILEEGDSLLHARAREIYVHPGDHAPLSARSAAADHVVLR